MKHEEGYLIVCNKKIEIVYLGPSPKDTPTLVFLHEGLGCVALWRDYPAKLVAATGCGAVVYSRVGYGKSEPCALPRSIHFMHDEGCRFLPELLEAVGIQECVLIGHSDGGSISLIYAGGTPAKPLRGVITEAAHVFCEASGIRSIREAVQAFQHGDLCQRLHKYHGANTNCAFWGWADTWLRPEFSRWNIEEYLPRLTVPTLVIQGENDEYGTIAQVEAIRRQAGAGAEVVMLPACGHSPHRDQEAKTLEAMTHFISAIFNRDKGR